jgi:hypothetical protein
MDLRMFFGINKVNRYDIILFSTFIFIMWAIVGIIFLFQDHPAWYITAVCVLISGRVTQMFFHHRPLLFTAMSLLAFTMALLLLFWGGHPPTSSSHAVMLPSENIAISMYTSFLTVYIGALLMLDEANGNAAAVDHLTQRMFPWLAATLVVILGYAWPSPLRDFFQIDKEHYALLMDFLLGAVGFAFIVVGVNHCCGGKASLAIATVLVGYQLIGLFFLIAHFRDSDLKDDSSIVISPHFAYFFSVAKLTYTVLLSWLVARRGMQYNNQQPEDGPQDPGGDPKGIMMFIMMFFGLR